MFHECTQLQSSMSSTSYMSPLNLSTPHMSRISPTTAYNLQPLPRPSCTPSTYLHCAADVNLQRPANFSQAAEEHAVIGYPLVARAGLQNVLPSKLLWLKGLGWFRFNSQIEEGFRSFSMCYFGPLLKVNP